MEEKQYLNKWDPTITPWQIREQDYPIKGSMTDKLKFLLRYAILAPSGHNSQPWKFLINNNEIQIFADKDRWLKIGDPEQVNLHIAIGCVLETLLIAAEHFGYEHYETYFPEVDENNPLVIVKLEQDVRRATFREPGLFNAIPNRHTNRKTYEEHQIPINDLKQIQKSCIERDIQLHVIEDIKTKQNINELLIRGHTTMIADPAFRRENAYWLKHGLFNLPRLFNKIIGWIVPHLKVHKSVFVMMDTKLVMSAPALIILSAYTNDKESQIKVGQVFARVCLTATMLGLCVHPLSGAVDVPELKVQISKLLPNEDMISQHIFRIGYAKSVKSFAKRRPLEEVLL